MVLDNSFLEKISLILSIIGIFAVFLIAQGIEPRSVEISEIDANLLGYQISVEGYVTNFYWHDGHFFATLSKNRDELKLVMFERDARKFQILQNVIKNSHLQAIGTISEYEGELEIVTKEVRIIEK